MKFTILPEKKKRIKAISQASKELNYKVFLADDNDAVLVAAFAFKHEADNYVARMIELTKAIYTVVYTPSKPDETPPSSSFKPGKIINNLIPGKLGKGLTVRKLEQLEPEPPSED